MFSLKSIAPKSKIIKVQSTSVARRKGFVESSKKLPSGRFPLLTIKKKCNKEKTIEQKCQK